MEKSIKDKFYSFRKGAMRNYVKMKTSYEILKGINAKILLAKKCI